MQLQSHSKSNQLDFPAGLLGGGIGKGMLQVEGTPFWSLPAVSPKLPILGPQVLTFPSDTISLLLLKLCPHWGLVVVGAEPPDFVI